MLTTNLEIDLFSCSGLGRGQYLTTGSDFTSEDVYHDRGSFSHCVIQGSIVLVTFTICEKVIFWKCFTISWLCFFDTCSLWKSHQRHCHRSQQLSQLSSQTLSQLSTIFPIFIRDIVTAVTHCHNCQQRHCHSCQQFSQYPSETLSQLLHIVTIVIRDIVTAVTIVIRHIVTIVTFCHS